MTGRTFDNSAAQAFLAAGDEFSGVTLSTERQALKGKTDDATGAKNPFERAKVHIAYGYGLSGAGVRVGVVDAGFNLVDNKPAHQDFDNDPQNADSNGSGKFVVLTSTAALASDSHGIHVSGLLTGERDGKVMHGVAYGAQLYLGMSPSTPTEVTSLFKEYTDSGVKVSSNSYGFPLQGDGSAAWKPVQVPGSGSSPSYEVTAKNVLDYMSANSLTATQALSNMHGGTAEEWQAALDQIVAYQNAGGIVLWANSNYGTNAIDNKEASAPESGLDDVDSFAALPLIAPQVQGAWITVTNGTSIGLATQVNGEVYVANSTAKENGIYLFSARCGIAKDFCLTMDGVAMWSGSNKGIDTYESQSGTSQATPQTAGMIALLREAFPTASAKDLTARLLFTADNGFFVNNTGSKISTITTASYTNANGTITHQVSDYWGHGFPDLEKALQPVGTTTTVTAAGEQVAVAAASRSMVLGGALGSNSGLSRSYFLYNDQLNGVFSASASSLAQTGTASDGVGAIVSETSLTQGGLTLVSAGGSVLSFAQGAALDGTAQRVMAFKTTVGEETSALFGYGFSIDQGLGFDARGGEFAATGFGAQMMAVPVLNFDRERQGWVAGAWATADFRATVGAFGTTDAVRTDLGTDTDLYQSDSRGVVADLVFNDIGPFDLNVTFGVVSEERSFLGTAFRSDVSALDAESRFSRIALRANVSEKIALTGSYTWVDTSVKDDGSALIGGFDRLRSDAFAFNVEFDDAVGRDSRLTLGIAQPLAVVSGRASLNLPDQVLINEPGDYTYGFSNRQVDLGVQDRQLDFVVDMERQVTSRFSFGIGGKLSQNPGHDPDAALGYSTVGRLKWKF
ncbi:S8 family serine peptidase [Zavarzinia compransoris]|uniref:S8 family serine peptidase n=1 Tax=Zavarzinia compransoris TaxID=1264899 RepID=UPI0010E05859|nr:S8 family serine peptidase [Zavarzinia compransoris]TDP48315.1 subtilase family protein [Zavarzinia compransoris]